MLECKRMSIVRFQKLTARIAVLTFLMPQLLLAQQVGLVHLRVDADSVTMRIDGGHTAIPEGLTAIPPNEWVSLELPVGDHLFEFLRSNTDPILRSLTINVNDTARLDIQYGVATDTSEVSSPPLDTTVTEGEARLVIESDPPGANIYIDNEKHPQPAPDTLMLPSGEYVVELYAENHEPLAERIKLYAGQNVTATFVLTTLPPAQVTAAELGLMRLPEKPLMDEKIAQKIRDRWQEAAETFLLVPFGQGVMAKVVMAEENQNEANKMVIGGAILTLGTYFVGKILSKRKLNYIRKRNLEIPLENQTIAQMNREIDETVKEENAIRVSEWLEATGESGVVRLKLE